jgi:hypothetical protein
MAENGADVVYVELDAEALQLVRIPHVTQSVFCPPEKSDVKAWQKKSNAPEPQKTHTSAGQKGRLEIPKNARPQGRWMVNGIPMQYPEDWFCDKMPVNLDPWEWDAQDPKTALTQDDVVLGVYTGEKLWYTRASAQRDTWFLRFPHSYIFAATTNDDIPISGLEKYGVRDDSQKPDDVTGVQVVLTVLRFSY